MAPSPEHDAYIEGASEFAKPILRRLRGLFHRASPQMAETIKWGAPHFEDEGIVGSMAAFKHHVSFGLWKGAMLDDPTGVLDGVGNTAMSLLRFRSLDEMPADEPLLGFIIQGVALNRAGVRIPRTGAGSQPEVPVPEDLAQALSGAPEARSAFEAFSPSNRREYLEWITEAKRLETREKRLRTAMEWMAEGKPRNWKYMKRWK